MITFVAQRKLDKHIFIKIFCIYLLSYFSNISLAKAEINESLNQVKSCLFGQKSIKECRELILLIENIQMREYKIGNFKCQTSLLGLQTELINQSYFSKSDIKLAEINIKHVIKNC